MWHLRFPGGIWHGENIHTYVCIGQGSEVKKFQLLERRLILKPVLSPPSLHHRARWAGGVNTIWLGHHPRTEDSPLFLKDWTSSAVCGMFGTGHLRAFCTGIVNVTASVLTTGTLIDLSLVHEWIWADTWKNTAAWLPEPMQMFGLHETVPTEVPQSRWCVCVHSGQDYRLNIWTREAV